jgi:hypothetical protein
LFGLMNWEMWVWLVIIVWLAFASLNIWSVWKKICVWLYICKHVLRTSLPTPYGLTKLILF